MSRQVEISQRIRIYWTDNSDFEHTDTRQCYSPRKHPGFQYECAETALRDRIAQCLPNIEPPTTKYPFNSCRSEAGFATQFFIFQKTARQTLREAPITDGDENFIAIFPEVLGLCQRSLNIASSVTVQKPNNYILHTKSSRNKSFIYQRSLQLRSNFS